MSEQDDAPRRGVRKLIRGFLYGAPWRLMAAVFRTLYGFRVENAGAIPSRGPFILVIHEPSLIGVLISGWFAIETLDKALEQGKRRMMGFMQDQLFALSYFRGLLNTDGPPRYGALVPHSAGRMALSLVDGYRALRDGGVVTINPEGDGPWDGRPLPTGKAPAWLGLHTGAPIVPAICSIGGYDIWPRWGSRPFLRGRLRLTVGEPFTLTDEPKTRVADADIAAATARIRSVYNELRYGPGGYDEWVGTPTLKGAATHQIPRLVPRGEVADPPADVLDAPSVAKRGVAQLLWRCPICQTNDAIVHRPRMLRADSVVCRACDTEWRLRHCPEKDFRMEVVQGAFPLIGFEMALSAWYDEMKRRFVPEPADPEGLELLPGEDLYLTMEGAALSPHRPNPLLEGTWFEREAPSEQPGQQQLGEWESIGSGRLLLTSQRLTWQADDRELEFRWSRVTAIYLWMRNTLGLMYGTARYRIGLGGELGLKWLTYAGAVAEQVERESGYQLTVSTF